MSTRSGVKLDANNDMGAFETYLKRLFFNSLAYPRAGFGPDAVKDFQFGERMQYGRINQFGRPIQLSNEGALKSVKGTENKTVRLLNFVADAFEAMTKRIKKDISAGAVPNGPAFLLNLSPKRGYISPNSLYREHVTNLFRAFEEYVKKYNLDKEIRDINSFYAHHEDFKTLMASMGFPCTMSGFMKSRLVSPLCTGLVVDLELYDVSDDSKKMDLIDSQSFEYYAHIAKIHGFSINKHIPSRLVIDLASPYIKTYMENYGLSSIQSVFQSYFKESYTQGYTLFKRDMITFYNQYINKRPFISTYKVCNTGCVVDDLSRRYPVVHADEIRDKGEKYFLDQYIEMRNVEEEAPLSVAKVEYLKKRSHDLASVYTVGMGLLYVEHEYSKPALEANAYSLLIKRVRDP